MNIRIVVLVSVLLASWTGVAACAPTRPTEPVAVVRAAYDSLNRGDVDGYMAFCSEDAIWSDRDGRHVGAQEIREYLQELAAQQTHIELSGLSANGSVVTYTARTIRGTMDLGTVDGRTVVQDGRIIWDGVVETYLYECGRDPSLPYCLTN